jgi:hypothetical protein
MSATVSFRLAGRFPALWSKRLRSSCTDGAYALVASIGVNTQKTITKGNGSSWIFEPCLTGANALQRVQHPAFALVRIFDLAAQLLGAC